MPGHDRRLKRTQRMVSLLLGSALALSPIGFAAAPAIADPVHVDAPAMPSFANVVEKVSPAVVSVRASGETSVGDASGFSLSGSGLGDLPGDHSFKHFLHEFMERHSGRVPGLYGRRKFHPHLRPVAQGSGFFISADGYVVTNSHIVEGARAFTVVTDDGRQYDAKLVGSDRRTDIAVLKVDASKPFTYVAFAGDAHTRVGDWVVAVGNPFGLGTTVTAGIISARSRDIGAGPYDDFIQIDAAISRGNSGGPAFDLQGEVIGINTAIFAPSAGNVGIAFAIPAATAERVVNQLIAHGAVERGWIGVQIQSMTRDIADSLGLKSDKGAIVSEPDADGPAGKAGIGAGDVITAVDGQVIKDSRDLARRIAAIPPGTEIKLTIWRHGTTMSVPLKVSEFPSVKRQAAVRPSAHVAPETLADFGLKLFATEDGHGVLITDVAPGSEAEDKGLQPGDIILSVNDEAVQHASDIEKAIQQAAKMKRGAVLLQVRTDSQTHFVALPIDDG